MENCMFNNTVPENIIPKMFYKVFVFKTIDIEESEVLLNAINFDLNKLTKLDYRNSLTKNFYNNALSGLIKLNTSHAVSFKTFVNDNGSITNFIFITEDEILKAASYSGNIEANLYTRSINYRNLLANQFKKDYKVVCSDKQASLI